MCIFKRCFHGNATSVDLHTSSNIYNGLSFLMLCNLYECKGIDISTKVYTSQQLSNNTEPFLAKLMLNILVWRSY